MKKEIFVRICVGFSEVHGRGRISVPGLNFSSDFNKNRGLVKKLITAIKSELEIPNLEPREDKRVSLEKGDDLYAILADPYIWQRQRIIVAIRIILMGVIEEEKSRATWYTKDEEINFLEAGINFPRIEKIAYDLIEVGEIEHAIYVLEDMRERIENPLVQGFAYFCSKEYKQAEEVFSKKGEKIEKQMAEWFG